MDNNSSTTRNALRNTLLENGYVPLPLADKGIYIKGWVAADVDADWLAQYERNARYVNTGIRCDNLFAFDIDVLDEKLADEIEDLIQNRLEPTPLCRVGRWPKRLLVYRCRDEDIADLRSSRTAKFNGKVTNFGINAQIELLAGCGRQFAAFGTHPSGVEYEWLTDDSAPAPSPLNVPADKLPAISEKAALETLQACEDHLRAAGLQEQSRGYRHGGQGGLRRDLGDDFEILLADGEETTWGRLRDTLTAAGVFGNIRRENGEFGDSDAVHFFLAAGSNEPCAHDFVRDVTHWASLSAPPQAAAALANVQVPSNASMFTPAALTDLQENFVIMSDLAVRPLSDPTHSYPLQGFTRNRKHLTMPDPNNPAKTLQMTDVWERSPASKRADHAELRPDRPNDDVFEQGRIKILNTYRPPVHVQQPNAELDTVHEFIEHLLPNPIERDIFLDWHAAKIANPHWRMHALLMVTEAFGTGRGTWAQILERLFGVAYVKEIPLAQIIGSGSQAQYNEFLAESLVVTVGEALVQDENRSKWTSRRLAYERIKTVIEPQATYQHIRRKYGRNTIERVFASLYIQSNHYDALAIEPEDRRIVVLSNTETELHNAPGSLLERIHEWKDEPGNIAALYKYFLDRWAKGIRYEPMGMPPMTPAKQEMIEAAQSDAERLYEIFQQEAAGDCVLMSHWRAFAYAAKMKHDLDLPDKEDKLNAALIAVLKKHARRPTSLSKGGTLKLRGAVVRPWIIRNTERWLVAPASEIRDELDKNRDPDANIVPLKKSGGKFIDAE